MKELIAKVNHYWLLCQGLGMVAPPKMVDKCTNFAIGVFAERLLNELFSFYARVPAISQEPAISNKIRFWANKATGYSHSSGAGVAKTFIHFDFSGWKTSIGKPEEIYEALENNATEMADFPGIELQVCFNDAVKGAQALWMGDEFILQLFINSPPLDDLQDFRLAANRLDSFEVLVRSAIEHELIHMSQNIGQIVKDTKELYGMPKKNVRQKGMPPHGQIEEDGKWISVVPHAERDIEFYTNLNDAINTFQYLTKNMDVDTKKLFMKVYIGAGNEKDAENLLGKIGKWPKIVRSWDGVYWWFRSIKNPERWKLAVKRFMERIS